jgi:hypothetical protein
MCKVSSRKILLIDYYLISITTLCRRIWMSFFGTEEAHAVMPDTVADRGPVDHRSSGPGSSVKSRLKAPAQFGAKKDIHILHCCLVKQNGW